jgi:hypothetical protein
LVSLFLMIFTGVPAIWLGYRTLKAIDADPQRLKGKWMAQGAILTGWIGCSRFAWNVGSGMGNSGIGGGIVGMFLGFGAIAGVVALKKKWSWDVPRSIAVGLWPALITLGSVVGVVAAHAEASAKAEKCDQSEKEVMTKLASKNPSAARSAVSVAQVNCPDTEGAKIAKWTHDISDQEQAAQAAETARVAAANAAAVAAKEKAAVESFPQKSTEITASYKRAVAATNGGHWAEADTDLGTAEMALASFMGTSVAQSPTCQALQVQVGGLRKKVDGQLQRVATQKAAREAAAEAAQDDQNLRELLAQYKDNEVRADAIYKGKQVRFAGLVNDVKKDITDSIYVTVGTGEWLQIPEVQCFFADSKARQAAQLSKGQHVRVRGIVKGLMMNVLVQDCDFVE